MTSLFCFVKCEGMDSSMDSLKVSYKSRGDVGFKIPGWKTARPGRLPPRPYCKAWPRTHWPAEPENEKIYEHSADLKSRQALFRLPPSTYPLRIPRQFFKTRNLEPTLRVYRPRFHNGERVKSVASGNQPDFDSLKLMWQLRQRGRVVRSS